MNTKHESNTANKKNDFYFIYTSKKLNTVYSYYKKGGSKSEREKKSVREKERQTDREKAEKPDKK